MSEELLQEHKTLLFFDFALTSSEALYNILEFVALTAGKPEDALESFNAMVRKQLAPRVVSGLGRARCRFHTPCVCAACEYIRVLGLSRAVLLSCLVSPELQIVETLRHFGALAVLC